MAATQDLQPTARGSELKTQCEGQKPGRVTKRQTKRQQQREAYRKLRAAIHASHPGTPPLAASETSNPPEAGTPPLSEGNKPEKICISPSPEVGTPLVTEGNKPEEIRRSPSPEVPGPFEVATPHAPEPYGYELKVLKIFEDRKLKSIIDYSSGKGVKVFDRARDQEYEFLESYFHGRLVELANTTTGEVVFRTRRSLESLGHVSGLPVAASYRAGKLVATLDLATYVYQYV